MWFTRVSISNPVMATMMMLALVVLGLFSYQRLKVDQFPSIEFPTVVVQMDYPGASPEIVESEVTRKVEETVNTIAGINQLTSRSYEGTSVVIVQFDLAIDSRKAAEDVREKVALVRPALRDEVGQARVMRFDPSSRPVFSLALTGGGELDVMALSMYADKTLRPKLENVRGVGSVSLVGQRDRQIQIQLHPKAMEALGVSVDQVMNTVRQENTDLPAGTLRAKTLESIVQIDARLQRPQDFESLIVARHSGLPVRLGQIATVMDGPEEVDNLALYNGQRTLVVQILKAQGENTIEVVDGLNRVIDAIRPELPPGMELRVVADNSRPIRVSVRNVRQTLFEGALLTIGIVFLFLNSWRSTVITGLTLPISVIGTFAFMHAFGFTINMITLMALSLCVGLLIDDAIVVRENIVRHVQMGKSARQASLDGTQEIGLAVLATTLSIVAVFLPIGFMSGIIGKFFHEFGITIVAAVLISMFVSFTLDPMLSSIWHDPAIRHDLNADEASTPQGRKISLIGRLTGAVERASIALGRIYERLLGWALLHRKSTLALAAAALMSSLALFPLLGTEFVPKADYGETYVNFYTPSGTALELTEARTRQVDAALRAMPEVRYTVAAINAGQAQGRNMVSVYVRLVDRNRRQRTADQLSALLRQQLSRIPGITLTHVGLLDAVGGAKPLLLSLQGPDLQELQRLTQVLTARLESIPGLVDTDTSMKPNKPTVDVKVRRDVASDLGLSVQHITAALRGLVAGDTVGNWKAPDGENYDVRVALAPQSRERMDDLQGLGLAAGTQTDGSARVVRLSQVAELQASLGPNQINRRDMSREVEITANVAGRSLGEVSADVQRVLGEWQLPSGYHWRFGGSTKDMKDSFGYAISALIMAVIFIYMILASQFRSFVQPLALMSSLPMTLIGVVLMLLAFRSSFNMFSVIGVIMLMGLVTKNAILLVDFAIRARRGEGTPDGQPLTRDAALLLAAHVRLRPILMTTLAMIFGMVPLAFGLAEGSEQRAPMGQAVIGGVITSSLLTLVVVPVIYGYLDDLSQWASRRLLRPPPAPSAPS